MLFIMLPGFFPMWCWCDVDADVDADADTDATDAYTNTNTTTIMPLGYKPISYQSWLYSE